MHTSYNKYQIGIVYSQDYNTYTYSLEKLPLTHLLLAFQNLCHIVAYIGSMQFVTPTCLSKLLTFHALLCMEHQFLLIYLPPKQFHSSKCILFLWALLYSYHSGTYIQYKTTIFKVGIQIAITNPYWLVFHRFRRPLC